MFVFRGVFSVNLADHEKAVKIETECAVLLENNGILPLKEGRKVVYIGEYAEKPRYQGGGSSHINSSKVTSALESAKEKGRPVSYVKGFPFDKDEENAGELAARVEIYVSNGVDMHADYIFKPASLFYELAENVGYVPASSAFGNHDPRIVTDCMLDVWNQQVDWQGDAHPADAGICPDNGLSGHIHRP